VTGRFDRIVESDIARGYLGTREVDDNADWFLSSWKSGFFNNITPPIVDAKNAQKLAAEVADVYKEAYPGSVLDDGLVNRCLMDWNQNPARNPRRLIRLLIQRFDMNRHLVLG
jgi:hypothetical protein